jgi:hypothetical protein
MLHLLTHFKAPNSGVKQNLLDDVPMLQYRLHYLVWRDKHTVEVDSLGN